VAVQPHSTFAGESGGKRQKLGAVNRTRRRRHSIDADWPRQFVGGARCTPKTPPVWERDLIQSDSDKHFRHTSVLLRHASGDARELERQIETILGEAVALKRRVWVSRILFAELRPSTFVHGRFATLFELKRYIRSLATLVAADPNIMMRGAASRRKMAKAPPRRQASG
jgi:hypothetical protein